MRQPYALVIFLLLSGVTVYKNLHTLGTAPVEVWDESINIRVVSDTVRLRTFPYLQLDNAPFLEKPPIWYWTGMAVAGHSPSPVAILRGISALSGIGIICITVYISYAGYGYMSAVITWLMLLTTAHLFTNNAGGFFSTHTFRSADVDALLILLMMIQVCAGTVGKMNTAKAYSMGIAAGLALLTKGPAGLIPAIIYTLMGFSDTKSTHRTYSGYIWITAACISIPWYAGMTLRYGERFLYSHVYYHHISRIFSPLEGHAESWRYIPHVISSFSVFPGFIPAAVSLLYFSVTEKLLKDPKLVYITACMCVFFLIPVTIQTKLAWYLLPVYPFAAILSGASVSHFFRQISAKHV